MSMGLHSPEKALCAIRKGYKKDDWFVDIASLDKYVKCSSKLDAMKCVEDYYRKLFGR
jgi:hypothetical protein